MREPGNYSLHVVIGAYFGDQNPPDLPLPLNVGTHRKSYTECNFARALVWGGRCDGWAAALAGFAHPLAPRLPHHIHILQCTITFPSSTWCCLRPCCVCVGSVIGVELPESSIPAGTTVFGTKKCASGDNKGRWLNLDTIGGTCKPPYCTGPSSNMLFDYDWVWLCFLFFMFPPAGLALVTGTLHPQGCCLV